MRSLRLVIFLITLCAPLIAQETKFQFTHKGSVLHIKFSPSGSKLLSYSSGNQDLALWDVATGDLMWKRPISFIQKADEYYTLDTLTWSRDEKLIATASANGTVQLWNVVDGAFLETRAFADLKMESMFSGKATKTVTKDNRGFRVHDIATGAERVLSDCVSGSAFDLSADGRYFAQSCDGFKTGIRITDLNSDRSWLLDGHPSTIHAVVYSPDFSLLAVAGNDGNAYLFDAKTRTLKKTLAGTDSRLTALTFSNDGKQLITGDESGVLRRWDLLTGTILGHAKVSSGSDDIDKIEVSSDGKRIVILIDSAAILLDGGLKILHSWLPAEAAALDPTGTRLITAHSDGTIFLWDTSTFAQVQELKIAKSVKFVASVDRSHILAIATVGDKARFQLIDSVNGKTMRRSAGIEPSYLEKMFLSPDKSLAAVTDISGDVVICNLETMALRTLDNGLSGSDSVAFSRDAKTFFIGGEDQNLSLYDTKRLKKQWTLLSKYKPGPAETRLTEERAVRVAEIIKRKEKRDREAAEYVKRYRNKVYVTFEHYGDMSDPGEKRMVEKNELKESKEAKPSAESNAVWLRLHNDSTLPIEVPTESMYMPDPKCFFQLPNGEKVLGLCKDREIGIRFGVKDRLNKWIPYGFDFGSSAILLPRSSVLFPVPLSIWNKPYSVVFSYSFQNIRASENDREMDFGPKVEMRVSKLLLLRRPGV